MLPCLVWNNKRVVIHELVTAGLKFLKSSKWSLLHDNARPKRSICSSSAQQLNLCFGCFNSLWNRRIITISNSFGSIQMTLKEGVQELQRACIGNTTV